MKKSCCLLVFSFFMIQITTLKISKSALQVESTLGAGNKIKTGVKLTTKFCSPLCSECSTNDINYCTICKTGVILYNFNCYERCPEGTFLDSLTGSCRQCDPECPVCWGPEPNMCGTTDGVFTKVVDLEDEIKKFISSYTFTKEEIDNWRNSLDIIFAEERPIQRNQSTPSYSTSEIYSESTNVDVDLPIGSFAKFNGLFIPVPSYLNQNNQFVKPHFTFHGGMWNGKGWNEDFYPRLPSFVKTFGLQNQIFKENNGYWIWDQIKSWFWVSSNKQETSQHINDVLSSLNSIRFNLGDYNRRKVKDDIYKKKLKLQSKAKLTLDDIRTTFDNFLNSNQLMYEEMKRTIAEQENSFVKVLDGLKYKAHDYFGEEFLFKDRQKIKKEQAEKNEIKLKKAKEEKEKQEMMEKLQEKIENLELNLK